MVLQRATTPDLFQGYPSKIPPLTQSLKIGVAPPRSISPGTGSSIREISSSLPDLTSRPWIRNTSPAPSTPLATSRMQTSSSTPANWCEKSDFPRITTTILQVHTDEVWNIQWSHDGAYLASASRDKSAIIWRRGVSILCSWRRNTNEIICIYLSKSPLDSGSSSPQDWAAHHILRDHPYPVACLAWSLDDTILLTSAEHFIKVWNTKVKALDRCYMIKSLTPGPKRLASVFAHSRIIQTL